MYLMIDNYDSFVHNLAVCFKELGQDIRIFRNDCLTLDDIRSMSDLEGIIISPGPKSPTDSGLSGTIVREFFGIIPILGVCLGHQVIGHVSGALIEKGFRPMHGKVSRIYNSGMRLFHGLPSEYHVTRYHSLVVRRDSLSEQMVVDAYAEDGAVMAISHRVLPVFGVQFHPEALLTQYGHEILENFIRLSREWRCRND
ncbi:anthranilate synthase component II [Anaerobium acetethylicum]|uniref:Anthranilate synthase component 2/para-aminobenzoate synthetase component 2 n=1 Tax=Anaerobium acetethylicum TaxID=1619234 RepID=A0A1D3TT12_9FIRM|nr:aminodeoxychorismate/anthranilate synthase component II [Anaerobium acetethylicum]SCP97070.1 anthranilate synthase component 2/para-aminobenzoate synthetase component 2 [Anaerobium acetethylicum]